MTDEIKKGEIIGIFKPIIYLLSSSLRSFCCDDCFEKNKNLKKCSGCSYMYYCSQKCQKKSWKIHKYECYLLKNSSNPPLHRSLFLYRFYNYYKNSLNYYEDFFGKKKTIDNLMTHEEEIKKDKKKMEAFYYDVIQLKIFINQQQQQQQWLPRQQQQLDEDLLFKLFTKICINSFSIYDFDLNTLGSALYLSLSSLDHSCKPNCSLIFNSIKATLVSIETIKTKDHMTICYGEGLRTTMERRKNLENFYYFRCICPYCLDIHRDEEMNGREEMEKEEEKKFENDISKLISLEKNNEECSEFCEKFLNNWNNKLKKYNIYKLVAMEKYFEFCIQKQDWSQALHFGKEMLTVYCHYFSNFHLPLIQLTTKYSKILIFLDKLSEARKYLETVVESVKKIYFNTNFYQEFKNLCHECSIDF